MGNARTSGSRTAGFHKHRAPSPAEIELWRRAVANVQPIRTTDDGAAATSGVSAATPPAVADPAASPVRQPPAPPPRQRTSVPPAPRLLPAPSDLVHGTPAGIDKRTLARLRRGLIEPDTVLDLHSLTQDEAHRYLSAALAASQGAGRRCVLVITGKGYGADGAVGVLKTMVPRWLLDPPNRGRVLAFCHAARGHGGEGALYVLLRRVRRTPGD